MCDVFLANLCSLCNTFMLKICFINAFYDECFAWTDFAFLFPTDGKTLSGCKIISIFNYSSTIFGGF